MFGALLGKNLYDKSFRKSVITKGVVRNLSSCPESMPVVDHHPLVGLCN